MNKVGFRSDLFDDIVTSGELAHELILSRKFDFLQKSSQMMVKVFVIGNGEDDKEYISDCMCETASPEDASFVLVRGMFEINDGTAFGKTNYDSAESLLEIVVPWLHRSIKRGAYT